MTRGSRSSRSHAACRSRRARAVGPQYSDGCARVARTALRCQDLTDTGREPTRCSAATPTRRARTRDRVRRREGRPRAAPCAHDTERTVRMPDASACPPTASARVSPTCDAFPATRRLPCTNAPRARFAAPPAHRLTARTWGPHARPRALRTPRTRKNPGDDLFSRKAALSVSSALESLTSVFGMGTGVASPLLSPGFLRSDDVISSGPRRDDPLRTKRLRLAGASHGAR